MYPLQAPLVVGERTRRARASREIKGTTFRTLRAENRPEKRVCRVCCHRLLAVKRQYTSTVPLPRTPLGHLRKWPHPSVDVEAARATSGSAERWVSPRMDRLLFYRSLSLRYCEVVTTVGRRIRRKNMKPVKAESVNLAVGHVSALDRRRAVQHRRREPTRSPHRSRACS